MNVGATLIGSAQYGHMIDDYAKTFGDSGYSEYLAEMRAKYQWKDGVPKSNLFVRLPKGISKDDRAFVANGIRSFFTDTLTELFEKAEVEESLTQVNQVFNIMVYVIGAISLTIAFFLLLIATT